MQNVRILVVVLLAIFFNGCNGSELYRGSWKAMNAQGRKLEIIFEPNSFIIKDSTGKMAEYGYTQNGIEVENFVKTYGIILTDERPYEICFPKLGDESVGIIKDPNGDLLYTISRENYVKHNDMLKLLK